MNATMIHVVTSGKSEPMSGETRPAALPGNGIGAGHDRLWWLGAVAIAVAGGVIRWPLLAVPFERDEGEYAYAGQLILQGLAPYGEVYNMKLPGIYAAYAAMLSALGQSHWSVHLGLLAVNAATALLLFALGRRLLGPVAGLAAAASFVVLSVGQPVQGLFANAEHFVNFFAVAGLVVLLDALARRDPVRIAAAGLLLGTALLMKQHGIAFALFAGALTAWTRLARRRPEWAMALRDGAILLATGLLPLALTCLVLWWAGTFPNFWFWTFDYAWSYVNEVPAALALKRFGYVAESIVAAAPLVWTLAGLGLIATLGLKELRSARPFLVGFVCFAVLALLPGFYFRPHYFQLTLPAAALLVGAAATTIERRLPASRLSLAAPVVALALVGVALGSALYQQREYLFEMGPEQVARATYGLNPFVESLAIGEYIAKTTSPDARVFILGSEPQILFYAKRRSATSYVYIYPMLERQPYVSSMRQELMAQVEAARPEIIVVVGNVMSWGGLPGNDDSLIRFVRRYLGRGYRQVLLVEQQRGKARFFWSGEAQRSPWAKAWIKIFRRGRQSAG